MGEYIHFKHFFSSTKKEWFDWRTQANESLPLSSLQWKASYLKDDRLCKQRNKQHIQDKKVGLKGQVETYNRGNQYRKPPSRRKPKIAAFERLKPPKSPPYFLSHHAHNLATPFFTKPMIGTKRVVPISLCHFWLHLSWMLVGGCNYQSSLIFWFSNSMLTVGF